MPSSNLSITAALERHAHENPDKTALVFVDKCLAREVLTRQQLWDYCRKYAGVLKGRGLGKGDVVCNTLRNSPQRVITELGAITAGAISMNGQICFADGSDFISSLNRAKATVVLVAEGETEGAMKILKKRMQRYDPDTGVVTCSDVPTLKYIFECQMQKQTMPRNPLLEWLDAKERMVHEELAPDDVCQYMCTSGSTSMFKLVAFSSHVIMEFGTKFAFAIGAKEEDIYMNNRPLGWLGGFPAIHLAIGTCRVVFDESLGQPPNISECKWKMAYQEKCNICFTTPVTLFEFSAVREASGDEGLMGYRMRTILSGGGPVTRKAVGSSLENLTDEVVVCYASTEAGAKCCLRVKEMADFEEFKVGCPLPGVNVKVVDEDGRVVPTGQKGEIIIETTQSALYYVHDPVNTASTFQEGWIKLGDLGFFNAQGQLNVIGRDKFAILRDAIVYYPYMIEGFIRGCPGVKDVVVTGVPDEKWNEELCAVVVRQSGVGPIDSDDVKSFCAKGLANQDVVSPVPRYVLFVDHFPKSQTGKVDRCVIKIQACTELNLHPEHTIAMDFPDT